MKTFKANETASRKLSISKDTLKQLTQEQLGLVAGGSDGTAPRSRPTPPHGKF